MKCCKQVQPNVMPEFEGVPRETMFCLARMAYQLACAAETFYTGRERLGWAELSDAECEAFTLKVMKMLKGHPPLGTDQLEQLSFKMLFQLTTHV